MPQATRETPLRAVVPSCWGARPGGLSATRSKVKTPARGCRSRDAAAARRTARRQDAAACRSWRRRSRALLAPARLATAVAAARHSAACASCAVRGASLALCFSTQPHARGRCGSTDRPPSRRSCLPLVAATLARAACARSVGHRSRGGSALGGLRLLRCTRRVSCAVFLYAATRPWPLRLDGPPAVKTQLLAARGGDARARCLRPLGRPPQSRRLDTRRLAPPALHVARLLRCVSLRRRSLTSQQQKVANETVVGAIGPSKEVSQAVRRRSSVGMPQATRETPLRDGGTFVLGCPTGGTAGNQKQSENSGTEDADRETPLRPDGPPAVKTQLLAARGSDARARCLRPLGWPPQSRRLGTRRLAPPALYAARLLRCVSLRSHTPVAAAARRTARRQDAAACRSWRRRSRALLAPARSATAVAAARHSAACAACAACGAAPALRFSTEAVSDITTAEGSQRDGRRRNRALQGGEPGGPASVLGSMPQATRETPLRDGWYLRAGVPDRGAVGNQQQSENSGTEDADRETPLRLDEPPAVKTQLLAARGGDARARCLRPLGWPPQSRRLGTRRLAPPALYAARLLRCVSLRGHTPVAAAARRTARRQDAAACRSWRRRSRALLAPARLATAVAAARHSAACASCAARGAAPALCFSTEAVSDITTAEGSQRDGRRRNRALQGGEPGGPASVLGMYAPGDTGNPLRDGGTFVLGCPTGGTVGNQKQSENSGTEDADRETPLRPDGPPAVKTQLLAARGSDARARCLRPLGWPPQSRRFGTRRLAPPALYAARLLRCVSLRGHTPVAAAARRTARRQDAAACRSWRRRSRALLAPARLATAVAAARHSAACASCAVRGASLALCFSTRPHARGRCGSTDRPPSRRSCLPLVAATLARAACARSVGHRSRGGSALGGLRLLRCTRRVSCAVFLYAATRPWPLRLDGPPAVKTQLLAARGGDARARCLRPLGWPPQSRRLGTRRLAPPALYAARLLRCVSLRSHTPVAAAARRTARRQDAAACRSWRRRSRALLAPARLATAVAAARHSAACASCAARGASLALCFSTQPHARGRCGSTDRPPSRRSCLPLVAATLARAACARSVGHRSRGGSALGGLRLLRCTRRVSCAVFLYAVTRPWPLRLDGPPAVKTQLLAARGGDARARCLRPLGWPPQSRRLGTRRLAPPALYAARLLRCVSLRSHTPVAAAARRTARRQDAAACRSWRRRSRALLAPARLATAVAAARHSAACASCAVNATRPRPRRLDGPPAVKTQLLAARGGDARARCLRPLGWPPQSRRLGTRRLAPPALHAARLLRCVSLRSHTPVAAAARRTARRQDAAACRSWRRRSRALLAPARSATAVAAARHSAACAACAARGAAPALRFSTEAVSDITTAEGSQRDGRRRNRALQGGEPGGPASVLGRYAPGDTGNPLRDGGTFVLGCPTGETAGNQKQSENSGTEDADRETPLRPDGPPAVKTQLLAARGSDARARCLRPLGWPPQSRRLGTRRLAPPALYAARLLRCVSLRSHTPVAAAARRTARRQDAAACRSWRRRSRALLAPARSATAVAAARHSAACAACAACGAAPALRFSTEAVSDTTTAEGSQRDGRRRNRALQGGELGGPASVVGMYAPGDTGNPPSGRWYLRAGVPDRGDCRQPEAKRKLRHGGCRSRDAAAARRTARRQDAAACRSRQRRSRALLAPARLATAVAAVRHSAACASCAVRGASLALCFSTQPHARGRCGSTDRPPSRRSCLPLVAATLARAACARSVGHRSRGGSALGGLRRLRCLWRGSCAAFLYGGGL